MSYWHILVLSSTGYCSWCSKLFKNGDPGGNDTTNEEMITNSSEMKFATYNTSQIIDTNASQSGDGSGNGSEIGSQTKENTTTTAIEVERGGETDVVDVQNVTHE